MYPSETSDVDVSPRDIAILKARIKYPTATVRELQETIDEEYDISLSHNRVNDILRELRDEGLFQKVFEPDKDLFDYHLFRIAFHYPSFEERWEDCYKDLLNDPHVVMFFSADSYHEWQFVTQFFDTEQSEQWKREFFTKHGDLIAQFDKTALPNLHKFQSSAGILDDMLVQTEEGHQYTEPTTDGADEAALGEEIPADVNPIESERPTEQR